jgi:putative transposase
LSALAINSPHGHYTLIQGIIKYKQAIWLGHSVELQNKVIHQFHSNPLGGHSGYFVTFNRIKKLVYWPQMKQSVQDFVTNCQVCQQAKSERVPYLGLLQPLPVPDQSWKVVTMDFIEGLPTSSHYNCMLVVVDKFSKYA